MPDTTTNESAPDAASSDEAIVEAHNVTKRFGDQVAVDDLTLAVPPGIIFAFIGPSGSGKTTTVRLLTGVQRPTSGDVSVFGLAPSAFTERERARIGYMPQLSVLFPHLSINENLKFVASIYGMSWGRRGRLSQALEFVELQNDRRKRLRHASGGMQRRLALAAALVNDPQLLFLDEPTAGIDPVLRRKFWDHFRELRDQGRTLFVTTQYVGEAAYCDSIAVLREGRLLTVDTPDGLRRQAFGGEVIDLIVADRIEQELITDVARLEFVVHAQRTRVDGHGMRVTVDDADRVIPRLQQWLVDRQVRVESVDRYLPPFDDVFVNLVQAVGPSELDRLQAASDKRDVTDDGAAPETPGAATAPTTSAPPRDPPVAPPPVAAADGAVDTTPAEPLAPPPGAPPSGDAPPVAPPPVEAADGDADTTAPSDGDADSAAPSDGDADTTAPSDGDADSTAPGPEDRRP